MTEDERNLDLLAVFHYIVGGLTALLGVFTIVVLTKDSVRELFTANHVSDGFH